MEWKSTSVVLLYYRAKKRGMFFVDDTSAKMEGRDILKNGYDVVVEANVISCRTGAALLSCRNRPCPYITGSSYIFPLHNVSSTQVRLSSAVYNSLPFTRIGNAMLAVWSCCSCVCLRWSVKEGCKLPAGLRRLMRSSGRLV